MNKFVSGSRPAAKDGNTESGGVAQDGQTQNGETQDLTASLRGEGIGGSGTIMAGPKSWGNFQLLQRLGQGGFGEVYRAWDPVLEREIAVKLLLPGDQDAEQELISAVSEARALARVRHPNIVSVYGVERRDGRVGFWSDYVRGRTLQSLVETEGHLDAQRVASLGAPLCEALAAVHAAGLLHRDVKASNAMVDENGRVLLMDFGLSQELHGVSAPAGTPKYMAPELWEGGEASVQSDVYAMGVLLYFLAAGRYPAGGKDSRQEISTAIVLPAPLLMVLEKAIARNPAERYESAARFAETLRGLEPTAKTVAERRPWRRRLMWSAAALVLIAAVAAMTPRFRMAIRSEISGTTPAAYSDFLAAEDALVRYDKPGNVERAVSLYQKTIDRSPDFALAYAGLARACWRMYDNTSDAKWVEQANTAAAKALNLNPNLAEVQMTAGQLHVNQGKFDLGLQELQKALDLDARSGSVHAALADAYSRQGRADQSKVEYQNATDLDPDDWRWPNDLGALYLDGGEYKPAEEDLKLALAKTPDNAEVLYNLGYLYTYQKRLNEARTAFEQSIQLAPGLTPLLALGAVQVLQGDNAAAVKTYQHAVDIAPESWRAWAALAEATQWIKGDPGVIRNAYRKAIEIAEKSLKSTPDDPDLISDLGSFYANVHDARSALPLLRKAVLLVPKNADVLSRVGIAYEVLGRRDDAIHYLNEALSFGFSADYLRKSPALDDLRHDAKAPSQIRDQGPSRQNR